MREPRGWDGYAAGIWSRHWPLVASNIIVNIKSAGLGEVMIRSVRKDVLRSSASSINSDETAGETRKAKSGALVTTISSQAEAVGKFVGDCISTPIVQVGTLLSVLSYMLYTEPRLGVVVLLISVPQVLLVPMIQRRINVHVRERSRTLLRAGDLMVDAAQGRGASASSLGSEIGKHSKRSILPVCTYLS